jgi:hypothetical protein
MDAYRVDFEVPWLARRIEVNDNFLVRQTKLFQNDISAMGPWTAAICVESELRGFAIGSHSVVALCASQIVQNGATGDS